MVKGSKFPGMFHQDKPIPQQNLCRSLAAMLQSLPQTVFTPFLTAFWTIIAAQYSSIPSLRLDKYLLLIRVYVAQSFEYLAAHAWSKELLRDYLDLVKKIPFSSDVGDGAKIPYGLRYHVLDVWIDGFEGCKGVNVEQVLEPVEHLSKIARSKVLRNKAKDALADERLLELRSLESMLRDDDKTENEDFTGFD